jgi:putative protein kinase ArgK-like GTPase of G3E family
MNYKGWISNNKNEHLRPLIYQIVSSLNKPFAEFIKQSDRPKERKIAQDLFDLVQKSDGKAPFVGVAGIPGGGKSTFCSNVAEILKFEHGINALVIPMDGYHYYRHDLDRFENP